MSPESELKTYDLGLFFMIKSAHFIVNGSQKGGSISFQCFCDKFLYFRITLVPFLIMRYIRRSSTKFFKIIDSSDHILCINAETGHCSILYHSSFN